MVTDPQACQYYQKELRSQDEKFHLLLEKHIRDEYQDPKFKLRIHAEVILLDLFHRQKLRFWDGIRYIGVSKPACFLCYRYFQAHPLQVQTSGCSNNLYIQWQPSYVHEDLPTLVKEQENIELPALQAAATVTHLPAVAQLTISGSRTSTIRLALH